MVDPEPILGTQGIREPGGNPSGIDFLARVIQCCTLVVTSVQLVNISKEPAYF